MLLSLFELLRYSPSYVRAGLIIISLLLFSVLAKPYVLEAMDLSKTHISSTKPTLVDKVRAFKQYVRYSFRAARYDGDESISNPLTRNRAFVKGVDKDGRIYLDVYTMKGLAKTSGWIADIAYKNSSDVSRYIKAETSNGPVVVDTYTVENEKFFVIWLSDGTPINEALIANGIASPIDTPPTNIVNTLFKNHYKRILFN